MGEFVSKGAPVAASGAGPPSPRTVVGRVVIWVGAGDDSRLSEGTTYKPTLPTVASPVIAAALNGIHHGPPPPPPPALVVQATAALVMLAEATVPEPLVTLQVSPEGGVPTVTLYVAPLASLVLKVKVVFEETTVELPPLSSRVTD